MADKILFGLGIAIIVIAVVMLLGNFLGDSTYPAFLGVLGVIIIAVSRRKKGVQKPGAETLK